MLTAAASALSKDWKRIRTPSFDAVSNAPVNEIKKILEELETFRNILVTRFHTLSTEAAMPPQVYPRASAVPIFG